MPRKISPHNIHIDGSSAKNLRILRTRFNFVMLIFCAIYGLLAFRLFDLSILQGYSGGNIKQTYSSAPLTKETLMEAAQLEAGRSDITDRNGVLIASNLPVFSLYADPKIVKNAHNLSLQLARIIPDIPAKIFYKKLSGKGRFIWLKRGLTPAQHKAVNALGAPALRFEKEYQRFYPQDNLMTHALGYINIDGEGKAGLEARFQNKLEKAGAPLRTTLDVRIQYAAQQALSAHIKKFNAIGGAAIVANVKNGEILAAVSLPDYSPHKIDGNMVKSSAFFNRFEQGAYEMGSTFKIFATAAYLDARGTKIKDIFDARKPIKRGRFRISDFHPEKRKMSVAEVFLHSSNIGTALMAEHLGTEAVKAIYGDLGFFERINNPVRGVRSSRPLIPQTWRDINTLTASYGHGIAVSPLHLMQGFLSTINDGTQSQLTFIPQGEIQQTETPITQRIFSKDTVKSMRALLRLAVTHGTGSFADVHGYQIGGKTGTAEKNKNGRYSKEHLISSFIGAFPMNDPEYAIFVMVDEPKGNQSSYGYATAGWVAAPAVEMIASDIARIYSIPPMDDPQKQDEDLLRPLMPYIKDKTSNLENKKKLLKSDRKTQAAARFIGFEELGALE